MPYQVFAQSRRAVHVWAGAKSVDFCRHTLNADGIGRQHDVSYEHAEFSVYRGGSGAGGRSLAGCLGHRWLPWLATWDTFGRANIFRDGL